MALELWWPLVSGVMVAGLTSWITVHLSLRRFRQERWWERKLEAYRKAIGSLHELKRELIHTGPAASAVEALTERQRAALDADGRWPGLALFHSLDVDELLLSKEALTIIYDVVQIFPQLLTEKPPDYDKAIRMIENARSELVRVARKDLGQKRLPRAEPI